MEHDIARILAISIAQKVDQVIIAHGHGALHPTGHYVPVPKGMLVLSYTTPGLPIYANQTKALLDEFASGLCPYKAAKGNATQEDLQLLCNNDQCPPYITTTKDHNGYEPQSGRPLGIYLWRRNKGLERIGKGKHGNPNGGFQFSIQDVIKIAQQRKIKAIVVLGCKTQPTH